MKYDLMIIPLIELVVLAIISSYLGMKMIMISCIIGFCCLLMALAWYGAPFSFVKKITNIFVYLHALTLFLPWGGNVLSFLPRGPKVTITLGAFLFVLSLVFFLPQRSIRNNRSICLNALIFWIIFSSLLGIVYGYLGMNSIRAHLPLIEQLRAMGLFIDALLVYFIIIKNKWGLPEFERFFRIILFLGCIIIGECILEFYLGLNPDGKSLSEYGHFNSMFLGRNYYPGVIGISVSFISIYFWKRYQKHRLLYISLSVLGCMTVFSSLSRSVIASCIVGLVLVAFFLIKSSPAFRRLRSDTDILKPSIVVGSVILVVLSAGILGTALLHYRPDTFHTEAFKVRGYRYARATDVFMHHYFLGAGFGMVPYYSHSSSIEPVISKYFSGHTSDYYRRNMIQDPAVLEMKMKSFKAESVHSLSFDFIVGLGFPGLLFFCYFVSRGVKVLLNLLRFANRNEFSERIVSYSALYALVLSVCLVVQTTSKFESYWYFAILFGILNYTYSDMKILESRQSPAH